jgi:hypothetical protein
MSPTPESIWIGRVHVGPLFGSETLEGAAGAYANVVALCESRSAFEQHARTVLKDALGVFVLGFEEVS